MNYFLLFMQLLPQLVPLVHQLEVAIPGTGKGKARLDTVLGSVEAIYNQSPDVQAKYPWGRFAATVTGVVGAIVVAANTNGVFAHAGKPGAEVAPKAV